MAVMLNNDDEKSGTTQSAKNRLLVCPVRGNLNATLLVKDGLTITEEAQRIQCIKFLLRRGYPKTHIAVETVVIKNIGESGRNKLRCDVLVFEEPVDALAMLSLKEKLEKAILVGEIKRESSKKKTGITHQLEPVLRQIPQMNALGIYWDDTNRVLLAKKIVKKGKNEIVDIVEDSVENLPDFGAEYTEKAITFDVLSPPDNLISVLTNVANVMRSHGINDEQLRYKETVKLILARYCDEKEAKSSPTREMALQVKPGKDTGFMPRVEDIYTKAAKRYSNAKTLFKPVDVSEVPEKALRDIVRLIQGIRFSSATSDVMQQIFMSFVPAVFKKSLDQFFTPISLIQCMVEMVNIGPNDKVADPGMGTADFLTAALQYRFEHGDDDIHQRIFGFDVDDKAYDLAVINMILHRDGQSNLICGDSIEQHAKWQEEIDVALCNPPFGEKSIERRHDVLQHYDLGYVWEEVSPGKWVKTEQVAALQQLGILFLERCYKFLNPSSGRLAIILPEGYLCTASYGYVRQWLVEHMRVIGLVELPRRIFLKSDADLRATVVVAQKFPPSQIMQLRKANYPIYAELVRKVGYKLGKGYSVLPKKNPETGDELRDENNLLIPDSDFDGVRQRFGRYATDWKWMGSVVSQVSRYADLQPEEWAGGRLNDVLQHPTLDIKPRRLAPKAILNTLAILESEHVRLGDIADVLDTTIDISSEDHRAKKWNLVEGQDIRAQEGSAIAQDSARGWAIAHKKGNNVYPMVHGDIIIGLVRPERRNVGMLVSSGEAMVGSPDGIAVVRIKPEYANDYPQHWLYTVLRSEHCRLQFWTESGGTSYGKLTRQQILDVVLPTPEKSEREMVAKNVKSWFDHLSKAAEAWDSIGTSEDRRAIINSPIFGLEFPDDEGTEPGNDNDEA